eukprot:CAMPEP_0185726362 /NCGR_PEP_ID=MMETSP1171-20130828/2367_1 /TAXON_ID=374046 /ORGANISM="Helicotheca tamensis, Strain CCMP826" /LENGTH=218 /DNA_ID=CAMNT_0028394699 /DNA_START=314 /DNA_END=966 /DNA_ORIENTATION=+
MSSEDQIKAQTNQSSHDIHMKMKRRRSASGPIQSNGDSQDTWDITEILESFDASDLRDGLSLVQQQLYAYHDLLDEMEKLKAYNEQLEREHGVLLKERSAHKKKLKKDARSAVQSLENEVVELKLELAQSRGREDAHNARMRDMLGEKESLEEEVKTLRGRQYTTATDELNNLVLKKTGLFRSINICDSLRMSDECVKTQIDKYNFSRRESEGNTISA